MNILEERTASQLHSAEAYCAKFEVVTVTTVIINNLSHSNDTPVSKGAPKGGLPPPKTEI